MHRELGPSHPVSSLFGSPCGRVFLVPKSSRGNRMVIDLSILNTFIQAKTFKMLDISKIRNSMARSAIFTSIDFQMPFIIYLSSFSKIHLLLLARSTLHALLYALWNQIGPPYLHKRDFSSHEKTLQGPHTSISLH